MNTTVTIPSLTKSNLLQIKLNVPTIEVQKYVVESLEKVDSLISTQKQKLVLLSKLVKSQFDEMFGDLNFNNKDWKASSLGEHIKFLTSGSRGWAKYIAERGELFLTIKNVKNCSIGLGNVLGIS